MSEDELIRKKNVNLDTLKKASSVEVYNMLLGKKMKPLKKEEFEALKRYIK